MSANAKALYVFDDGALYFTPADMTKYARLFYVQLKNTTDTNTNQDYNQLILNIGNLATGYNGIAEFHIGTPGTENGPLQTYFHGDVTVLGDLNVTGNINSVNQTDLYVEDTYIYLNNPEEGSAYTTPTDSGIAIQTDDGNGNANTKNPSIYWANSDNHWYVKVKDDDTAYPMLYGVMWKKIEGDEGNVEPDVGHEDLSILTATSTTDMNRNLKTVASLDANNDRVLTIYLNNYLRLDNIALTNLAKAKVMETITLHVGGDIDSGPGGEVTIRGKSSGSPVRIKQPSGNSAAAITITPEDYGTTPAILVDGPESITPAVCPGLNADLLDGHHASDFMASAPESGLYIPSDAISAGSLISWSNFGVNAPGTSDLLMVFVDGRKMINDTETTEYDVKYDNSGIYLHFDIPKQVPIEVIIFRRA